MMDGIYIKIERIIYKLIYKTLHKHPRNFAESILGDFEIQLIKSICSSENILTEPEATEKIPI